MSDKHLTITIICACLLGASLLLQTCNAYAEEQPETCWYEKQNARSVCRALGRKSPECIKSIQDYKLCRAVEQPSDPIGGIE